MTDFAVPDVSPELWDVVIVAGQVSPGLAVLSNVERPFEWDVKKGSGLSGTTSTFRGDTLAEPKLTLRLWLPEHWAALPGFLAALKFDPKKQSGEAFDISHPSLAFLDPPLQACVVKKMGTPVRERDGDTLYKLDIDLLEYRPPKKGNVTKTPKGASTTPATKLGPPFDVPDPFGLNALKNAIGDNADERNEKQIQQLLDKASQAYAD